MKRVLEFTSNAAKRQHLVNITGVLLSVNQSFKITSRRMKRSQTLSLPRQRESFGKVTSPQRRRAYLDNGYVRRIRD